MSLEAVRDESVGPRRLNALLLGGFGILALVIASIGIAAVLAFNVSAQPTRSASAWHLAQHRRA